MTNVHGIDALVVPPGVEVPPAALRRGVVTGDELAAMRRHVKLADDLRHCRYFTEEERSWSVTMDRGVTTSWEQTLPEAGATRDMLGLLRQLFGDKERASLASMAELLRRLADPGTTEGRMLVTTLDAFDSAMQGVLDSWDAPPGGTETSPRPPLIVFLDWMYGEFLHSDAEKVERIEQIDTKWKLYEWQFHWVADRLAVLFASFARVVHSALNSLQPAD